MSREPCPKCREQQRDTRGDNLVRYEDGRGKCFACGYVEHNNRLHQIIKEIDEKRESENRVLSLPSDADKAIDHRALTWLSNYGIIREEIVKYDLRWSPTRQWLCFPIRDPSGVLNAYQARNFGPTGPKWFTFGNIQDVLHILGPKDLDNKSPIVIVEDIVSAIRVGRAARSMPLFGSQMSLRTLMRLKLLTKEGLIFWLDADKYAESIKFAKRANYMNLPATVIYTEKDPKEYDDKYIQTAIGNAFPPE